MKIKTLSYVAMAMLLGSLSGTGFAKAKADKKGGKKAAKCACVDATGQDVVGDDGKPITDEKKCKEKAPDNACKK